MSDSAAMYRHWDNGQRHLVAGRYIVARQALEAAERLAWRNRDAAALARVYLPLLEARRQIRYQAAEGTILIRGGRTAGGLVKEFLARAENAGTLIVPMERDDAIALGRRMNLAAIRSGRPLELLVLTRRGHAWGLASPRDPSFSSGLPVQWTQDLNSSIASSADRGLVIPLPPFGDYQGSAKGFGAVARESILIAWEALALRWQHRHPPRRFESPWEEIAWLRRALEVDAACEPVAMRLMAVAEGTERKAAT